MKDLSKLGRDLKDIIIVDVIFYFFLDNFTSKKKKKTIRIQKILSFFSRKMLFKYQTFSKITLTESLIGFFPFYCFYQMLLLANIYLFSLKC